MHNDGYGSLPWFERFFHLSDDPWGVSCRASQRVRHERCADLLLTSLGKKGRILDVGCALGEFTGELAERFGSKNLIGIDFSRSAIRRAREKFPDLNFIEHNLLAPKGKRFKKESFDGVSCLEVFYYLSDTDKKKMLREIKSLMKKDGILISSSVVGPPPYFSEKAFVDFLSQEFKIEKIEKIVAGPYHHLEWSLLYLLNMSSALISLSAMRNEDFRRKIMFSESSKKIMLARQIMTLPLFGRTAALLLRVLRALPHRLLSWRLPVELSERVARAIGRKEANVLIVLCRKGD